MMRSYPKTLGGIANSVHPEQTAPKMQPDQGLHGSKLLLQLDFQLFRTVYLILITVFLQLLTR